MATAGVLEKSEKRAFLDDTTPLVASIVTNRVVPKQNYVVSCLLASQSLDLLSSYLFNFMACMT